jgi:protein O-mannosyl-transferase
MDGNCDRTRYRSVECEGELAVREVSTCGSHADARFSPASVWSGLCCIILAVTAFGIYYKFFTPRRVSNERSVVARSEPRDTRLVHWIVAFDHECWVPISRLSLVIETCIHGANHRKARALNVALHAITACLLFLLLTRISGSRLIAVLAAGTFAVHPLNVESVASVADRPELLGATFCVLSLLASTQISRQGVVRFSILSGVFALCAALSTSKLLPLAALIGVCDGQRLVARGKSAAVLADAKCSWRTWYLIGVGLIAAIALYGEANYAMQKSGETSSFDESIGEASVFLVNLLGRSVCPHWKGLELPSSGGGRLALAGAVITILAGTCAIAFSKMCRFPAICVGWLWFVISAISEIGSAELHGNRDVPSCAYMPLLGLVVIIVISASNGVKARFLRTTVFPLVALVSVVILARLTLADSSAWNDRWTRACPEFWQASTYLAPGAHRSHWPEIRWINGMTAIDAAMSETDDSRMHVKVGLAFDMMELPEEATKQYGAAIECDDEDYGAHYHLAMRLLANGQREAAERHFWRAHQINPEAGGPYVGIARICDQRSEPFEAMKYLECALNRDHEALLGDGSEWIECIFGAESLSDAMNRLRSSLEHSTDSTCAGLRLAKRLGAKSGGQINADSP